MRYQGEIVSKLKPVRVTFYRLYEEQEFDGTLSIVLYQCDKELPPSRKDSSVRELGTLRCNLDVQFWELQDYWSQRAERVKKLEFEIELAPSGASVEFVLYVNGRKQTGENGKVRFV